MDTSDIISIVIMAVCIMMSAYFSATETAFLSINKTRLKTMAEKGNRRAERVLKLSDRYDKLISTILIGNNIVNIAVASVATVFFVKFFGDAGATISTAVVTVLVLIFGEITPKNIAKDSPDSFACFSAPIIGALMVLFAPLNFLFSLWKKLINKLFTHEDDNKMSQEELIMIVEEVQQDGSIDDNQCDIIRNAIQLTELKAEDILTHRVDLAAVSLDASKEEIAELFAETQFSRLLVYEKSIDDIVGFIHQKDFYTPKGITEKSVTELLAPAIFVQSAERIGTLLNRLQKEKTHLAVVLDEYGGTLGIVSMEDILEEIVGDIWDEHDEVVETFEQLSDDSYSVDCSVTTGEFCEFFGIENESEAVSLGGFVMELFEGIPIAGDELDHKNLHITVTDTDAHRILKIRVTKHEAENESESEEA